MFSIILSMRHRYYIYKKGIIYTLHYRRQQIEVENHSNFGRTNKTYYLSISEDKKVFEVLLVFVLDLHDSGIKIIFTLII